MQAITVNNEGKIFLNTIPVTLDELASKLESLKSSSPDFPVVIRGDSASQYQGIMDVLNVVGRVGVTNIGLATQARK
jgi:biopolymer transport protein ExbD